MRSPRKTSVRQRRTKTHIRQIHSTDLEDLLSLAREASRRPHLDMEWLRYHTEADLTCLPALCLIAVKEQRIVGFCFGCMRDRKGIAKLFGVETAHRRAGIASALFEEMESRFRERGATKVTVGGVAPNYFCPGVSIHSTAALSFLLQQGYKTDRQTRVDMTVDLQAADLGTAEVEARLAKDGILLRRAGKDEVEGVAAFVERQFSAIWRAEVESSDRFHPLPLFVALKDSQCIAFAAYDVTGRGRFGPTGTHFHYRRRGIGSALLKKCLESMQTRGDDRAEIGWAGPIDYYAGTVGAHIQEAYWMFHKMLNQDF